MGRYVSGGSSGRNIPRSLVSGESKIGKEDFTVGVEKSISEITGPGRAKYFLISVQSSNQGAIGYDYRVVIDGITVSGGSVSGTQSSTMPAIGSYNGIYGFSFDFVEFNESFGLYLKPTIRFTIDPVFKYTFEVY